MLNLPIGHKIRVGLQTVEVVFGPVRVKQGFTKGAKENPGRTNITFNHIYQSQPFENQRPLSEHFQTFSQVVLGYVDETKVDIKVKLLPIRTFSPFSA